MIKYCIAGFFEAENFHESIAIHEIEIFTKSIEHQVLLIICEDFPLKVEIL